MSPRTLQWICAAVGVYVLYSFYASSKLAKGPEEEPMATVYDPNKRVWRIQSGVIAKDGSFKTLVAEIPGAQNVVPTPAQIRLAMTQVAN